MERQSTTPSQPTVLYASKILSGPILDPFHMAIVSGTGRAVETPFYRLLRRRLLILCIILLCVNIAETSVWLLLRLFDSTDALFGGFENWISDHWKRLVILVIWSASGLILWLRPPPTVRGLRWIELIVLGTVVAALLHLSVSPSVYSYLEEAAHSSPRVREALVGRYANAGGLLWMIVLAAYGILVPNSFYRTAIVCSCIAIAPLILFAGYSLWVKPIDREIVYFVLIGLGITNAIAVAIVLFASSRIEYLRKQADEARKLGQYFLKERLGGGGMGEVFRAEHILLKRPCAIKVIRPENAGDLKLLRRFEREVQITATLTHPNTIQVFDFGHTEEGTFYYVMEYLQGQTLDQLVRRNGPLPPAKAIHFVRQICAALREAHSQGLIHRDVKPGNVMVCERGGIPDVAKLLDFGLVLPPMDEVEGDKLTQDGTITGTPAYLSPEQASCKEAVDARSDIYSLGALAYFLLAGRSPFAGRSKSQMLAAHIYEVPLPISTFRPDISAELDAIIQKCLAKKPDARFQDVGSVDAALARCHVRIEIADV